MLKEGHTWYWNFMSIFFFISLSEGRQGNMNIYCSQHNSFQCLVVWFSDRTWKSTKPLDQKTFIYFLNLFIHEKMCRSIGEKYAFSPTFQRGKSNKIKSNEEYWMSQTNMLRSMILKYVEFDISSILSMSICMYWILKLVKILLIVLLSVVSCFLFHTTNISRLSVITVI